MLREVVATLRTGLTPVFGRIVPLPAPARDPSRPPVVLVHGFMGHPDQFRPLMRRLLEAGYADVHSVGYPSTRARLEDIVSRIDEAVVRAAGTDKVCLVGHSLGAVACRAYTKVFGGHRYVARFVSLGGPHAGTTMYRVAPPNLREALNPRGEWVRRLAEGPERVPTVVIRARYDHQVLPPRRASLVGVREIVVGGHGHNGLLWAHEAQLAVLRALRG